MNMPFTQGSIVNDAVAVCGSGSETITCPVTAAAFGHVTIDVNADSIPVHPVTEPETMRLAMASFGSTALIAIVTAPAVPCTQPAA